MPVTLVHPGNESVPQAAPPPARLAALTGKKIGLLDISKPGGNLFLDRLESILRERYRVADVIRTRKPTFAKPAPADLREEVAARCEAVVEALAD